MLSVYQCLFWTKCLKIYLVKLYWWLSTRLQYPHCWFTADTAVLCTYISICIEFNASKYTLWNYINFLVQDCDVFTANTLITVLCLSYWKQIQKTLPVHITWKKIRICIAFHSLLLKWYTWWNLYSRNTRICLYYRVSRIPADALAPWGARVSACMLLS